jgi:hypothetical protein
MNIEQMVLEKLDLMHLLPKRTIPPIEPENIKSCHHADELPTLEEKEPHEMEPRNEFIQNNDLLAIATLPCIENKENIDLLKNLDMGEDRLSALHSTKPPLTGIEALEAPCLGISPDYEEEY